MNARSAKDRRRLLQTCLSTARQIKESKRAVMSSLTWSTQVRIVGDPGGDAILGWEGHRSFPLTRTTCSSLATLPRKLRRLRRRILPRTSMLTVLCIFRHTAGLRWLYFAVRLYVRAGHTAGLRWLYYVVYISVPDTLLLYADAQYGLVGLVDLNTHPLSLNDLHVVGRSSRPVGVTYDPQQEVWTNIIILLTFILCLVTPTKDKTPELASSSMHDIVLNWTSNSNKRLRLFWCRHERQHVHCIELNAMQAWHVQAER